MSACHDQHTIQSQTLPSSSRSQVSHCVRPSIRLLIKVRAEAAISILSLHWVCPVTLVLFIGLYTLLLLLSNDTLHTDSSSLFHVSIAAQSLISPPKHSYRYSTPAF